MGGGSTDLQHSAPLDQRIGNPPRLRKPSRRRELRIAVFKLSSRGAQNR